LNRHTDRHTVRHRLTHDRHPGNTKTDPLYIH
jgi:hypothetical protein